MTDFPLNPEQKRAVEHGEGPLLIVAGAGTGKTRVLTERVIHLITSERCQAREILALAFNNDASTELENRVLENLPTGSAFPEISTFHSFCLSLVQEYGIEIGISSHRGVLEEIEKYLFLREHYSELPLDYFLAKSHEDTIQKLLGHFSKLQKEAIRPEKYIDFIASRDWEDADEHRKYKELAQCYAKYTDLKQQNGVLDFEDFHFYALKILQERPHVLRDLQDKYKYILVDEYQDTDPVQNQIINLLADKHKNLTVVGDDDQCIYRFRGASIENITDFQENYPQAEVVSLTENYRCTQEILDLAYKSIQYNNPHRLEAKLGIDKQLKAQTSARDSVEFRQFLHAEEEYAHLANEIKNSGRPLSDFAILARKTKPLHEIQAVFSDLGIATKFVGARGLYDRPEIVRMLSILEAIVHPISPLIMYDFLALEDFGIEMEEIYKILNEAKKYNQTVFNILRKKAENQEKNFRRAWDILQELTKYSRNNSAVSVAYHVLEVMGWKDALMADQDSAEGEQRILNVSKFLRKIEDFCKDNEKPSLAKYLEYYELLRESGDNPQTAENDFAAEAVTLSTVHRAKGLEWSVVMLPNLTKGDFPGRKQNTDLDLPEGLATEAPSDVPDLHLSEERRLFYVALTRAKEKLYLSASQYYRTRKTSSTSSPFLLEAGLEPSKPDKSKANPLLLNPAQKVDEVVSKVEKEFTKFSYSSLSAYQTCPRRFYYMQVAQIPTEPGANQQFGSQMHATLNEFMQRIRTQNTQPGMFDEEIRLDDLLAIWHNKFRSSGYLDRDMAEKFRQRGDEICKWFFEDWQAKKTIPLFLEQGFKFPFEGRLITGIFDRIDPGSEAGTCEIIDYKTGAKRKQERVDKDEQLTLYAMAAEASLGLKVEKLTLVFLPDHAKVSTDRTSEQIEKYQAEICQAIEGIEAKNFEAKPSQYSCGFCDFSGICPYSEAK